MAINAETVTAIVSAVGLSGIVAAGINAISNRKKTGADATKVITDAALGVVTQLQAQIKALTDEVTLLKQREDERDKRDDRSKRALMSHHQWDLGLADLVNRQLPDHVHLFPPPPLFLEEPETPRKPPSQEGKTT